MDSKGNVFYTDLTQVWKISPDGNHEIVVKDVHTHELFIDDQYNLYGEHPWYEGEATDKLRYYIWCLLDRMGKLGQTIPPTEGFPTNNTLIRDLKGATYWPEKRDGFELLTKETEDGQISHNPHKFQDIRWLSFSKNDRNLYVVDHLILKKVTPKGKVIVVTDKPKESTPPYAGVQDHHYLMGVWSDTRQNIYIAAYGSRKVKKIDAQGNLTTVYEASKGWSPTGGLVALDGRFWVMEFSTNNETRVKKIDAKDHETVFQG